MLLCGFMIYTWTSNERSLCKIKAKRKRNKKTTNVEQWRKMRVEGQGETRVVRENKKKINK